MNYLSVHVCEAEVAPLVRIRELFVIQSQKMQYGGLQIVDMDAILDARIPDLVRLAEAQAPLDASAGQPHRVSVTVVIATDEWIV